MPDLFTFGQYVHKAYAHLYDAAFLRNNILTEILTDNGPERAQQLHGRLVEAIDWLRPLGGESAAVEWRRYKSVHMRYIEGASAEQVAQALALSPRQSRRDSHEGLDEIARMLHATLGSTIEPAISAPSHNDQGDLDEELTQLAAGSQPATIELHEAIHGAISTVERLAHVHNVAIEVAPFERLLTLRASRTILRQLFTSALSELVIAAPGSRLRVDVQDVNGAATIEFATTPPVALGDQVRMLIGRLAEGLGGTLGPGPGGIQLRIPIADRMILLIDDNPDMKLLFRHLLAETGYGLVHARSAARAERLAHEIQPELVVLDLLLPDRDGWELLHALRADPATSALPVAICSVLPNEALARSLGVDMFLPKPVTRVNLLKLIDRVDRTRSAGPLPTSPASIALSRPVRTPEHG